MHAPHPPNPRDRIKAIGLMCLATALFIVLDTTAKYLGARIGMPMTQVVWVRFLCQFLVMVVVLGPLAVPRLFHTSRPRQQLVRSCLMLASTACNFLALRHLRLDQTQTIYFLTPLMVALLAGPLLGEWVGWRRLVAIIVGFCGILVVVRPGFGEVHWAFALSFGSMFAYAFYMIMTRSLSAIDRPEVQLFYSLLVGVIVMGPLAALDWKWPEEAHVWLLMLSMGLWSGVGHYLLILAHRMAPASIVAPFMYIGLPFSLVPGYFIFGDLPDHWTLIGGSIVIASGLYLLNRERVVRARASVSGAGAGAQSAARVEAER